MQCISSTDATFLDTLGRWLQTSSEILLAIRYSRAAGAKSFEFFSSFDAVLQRIRGLPAEASITAFRQPQLQLRGIIDDGFISRCLSSIADGTEFLVVETVQRSAGRASWFHEMAGESHAELREALEDSRGRSVAVGEYPRLESKDSPDIISAVVPDEHGTVRLGVY